MSAPNRSFLKHMVSLYENFNNLPLDIKIDGRTFTVTLKGEGKEFYLYPKFLVANPNYIYYINMMNPEVLAFSGWHNYRRPPCSEEVLKTLSNKVRTKEILTSYEVKLPKWSNLSNNEISPVVVKQQISSFASNIHGPFEKSSLYKDFDSRSDFFEEFIDGRIIKIWFWRCKPVLLESQPMPSLVGNGAQTIEELIRIRAAYDKDFLFEDRIDEVLKFYNLQRDSILEKDQYQMIDFRYASMLAELDKIDEFYFPLKDYPNIQKQVDNLSNAMKNILKIGEEVDFVFTADAILTDDSDLYILEVNTNPEIHPHLYGYMAESISSQLTQSFGK